MPQTPHRLLGTLALAALVASPALVGQHVPQVAAHSSVAQVTTASRDVVMNILRQRLSHQNAPRFRTHEGTGPFTYPYTVVADNRNNPRGLRFSGDGALYVAEGGVGGAGPCSGGEQGLACYGPSGSVTRIAPNGFYSRWVTGLPSAASAPASVDPMTSGAGTFASGPADIAPRTTTLTTAPVLVQSTQAWIPIQGAPIPNRNFATLYYARPPRLLGASANLGGFEIAHDPDGLGPDSDPYAVVDLPRPNNIRVVADAAGNDILSVDVLGRITLLAVIPNLTCDGYSVQPVPDSLTVGPDGAVYIGELVGGPSNGDPTYDASGCASVLRLVPGQQPTVYATGFSNIISLKFGPDNKLYVLEFSAGGGYFPPFGAILRANPDDEPTIVVPPFVGGLIAPTGLAIGHDGSFYVSNYGVCPGTPDPTSVCSLLASFANDAQNPGGVGQVIKFAPDAFTD